MAGIFNIISLTAVGILWGCTNPFIKSGSQGIDKINTGSSAKNLWLEFKILALRLTYWVPFFINQCGSILYVYTLQSCHITTAVPVANSLNFVFTALTGHILGEKTPSKNIIVGTLFVCVGSSLMLYDQVKIDALKTKNE